MAVATAHDKCPYCGSAIARANQSEIQARILAEEKRRLEVAELATKAKFESALKDANEKLDLAKSERATFEVRLKQAVDTATTTARKAAEDELAKKLADEIARAREALKVDFDKQMLKHAADASKEKDELAKKVAELQRKLEARGPHGEAIDIDVFEQLRAAFADKGDRIIRLDEDDADATLLYEITYKGSPCARILIDAKIRRNWQSAYATRLHDELVEQKADYALLATIAFPKDASELAEQNGVLLVHPTRVVELVRILRRALTKMFQAKLSTTERTQKVAKLYDFVTSEACKKKLAEPGRLATALLQLDVDESEAHRRMWEKRGEIERKIQNVMGDVIDEIDTIVDGVGDD